jgi:O-succinylbenzoate synthase
VRHAFVEPQFVRRGEPDEIIEVVKALPAERSAKVQGGLESRLRGIF